MKILGKSKLNPKTVNVPIGEDDDGKQVELKLRALRADVIQGIRDELGPQPVPPMLSGQVQKNPDGSAKRDSDGRPIPQRNEADPDYVKASTRYNEAFMMAFLLLSADGAIQPDTKREDHEDAVSYFLKAKEELDKILPDALVQTKLMQAVWKVMSLDQFMVGEQLLGVERTKPVMQVGPSGN